MTGPDGPPGTAAGAGWGFATRPADGAPLRVLQVGAGGMGRAWLRAVRASPEVTLVGLVDLVPERAAEALAEAGLPDVPVGTDLAVLAADHAPDAVLDVTVPAAHLPVTLQALALGLPVLGEKPLAVTLPEALRLAAAAEAAGQLFMVSQSRRYHPELFALRGRLAALGRLGVASTEFFRAPRFGGFRDAMAQPLLIDMAIHAFDTARWLLAAEPVSVRCESYNPPWSWYAGDAAATAVFEMTGGVRYTYTGSWCSPGVETSWNGRWRLSGEHGAALWEGEGPAVLDPPPGEPPPAAAAGPGTGIDGALAEFTRALRTGARPMGEVHDNLLTLAMVVAAVESAAGDRRVWIDELLDAALPVARAAATGPEADRLRAWPSARAACG
ncbi:Gfo/Idh/MocA family oxidoreductase [Streptomyces sp. DSM 44915]|uniref:Gfo/Idh/MocA family oxidoreductase n=1 Tax=Streptomyces chisholmiae TaxID=3075540 RepID=A0ABU2JKV4_9ACTN|nr:Gfo/Idh/MocA family oxidoreductase [Streptomyces sp. DSM 44915]MDT0265329.1 Gfo/Idh/MocA family oxidoreductase [Streptomyces sp. DSM 44915]